MKRSCRDGVVAFALGGMQSAAADEISDWNERVVGFAVNRKMPPPVAERLIAMMQVAMLDAVNSIDRKYRLYLVQPPAKAAASKEANLDVSSLTVAAATAAASLLAPATTALIDVPAPTIEVLT